MRTTLIVDLKLSTTTLLLTLFSFFKRLFIQGNWIAHIFLLHFCHVNVMNVLNISYCHLISISLVYILFSCTLKYLVDVLILFRANFKITNLFLNCKFLCLLRTNLSVTLQVELVSDQKGDRLLFTALVTKFDPLSYVLEALFS